MGVKKEKNKWDQVFFDENNRVVNEENLFSSYWWKKHYRSIACIGDSFIENKPESKIIEVGCGSGKNTLLLDQPYKKATLVDISPNALRFAKKIAKLLYKENKIETIEADMFDLPFKGGLYDLCWGVGVLEHYSKNKIIVALGEMLRVTKRGGIVAIGFPNPNSLTFKKAKFLGDKRSYFLTKYLKGYRNDTEIEYFPKQIIKIMQKAYTKKKLRFSIIYGGNITLVDTSKFIINMLKLLERLFLKNKFIFFVKIEKL